MSVSYWQDTVGITANLEADVTIIGGGLAGLSTAYWLNKKDLQEKGMVGNGASGRNAGFITCGSTDHFSNMVDSYGEDNASEIWTFTEHNHALMVEEFGTEKLYEQCDYRKSGSWTLASSKHEVKVIKASILGLKKRGVNVEWRDKIFEGSEGFYGGAYYSDETGEVAECMVKSHKTKDDLGEELSDVMIVVAVLALRSGIDLNDVCPKKQEKRVQKLLDRYHGGTYPSTGG